MDTETFNKYVKSARYVLADDSARHILFQTTLNRREFRDIICASGWKYIYVPIDESAKCEDILFSVAQCLVQNLPGYKDLA